MSKAFEVLNELKLLFNEVDGMNPREVSYSKESDNTGSMHTYILDTICKNGKILTVELITNFSNTFNAYGASYSLQISVSSGYNNSKIFGEEIERKNITKEYIISVLKRKGLKI